MTKTEYREYIASEKWNSSRSKGGVTMMELGLWQVTRVWYDPFFSIDLKIDLERLDREVTKLPRQHSQLTIQKIQSSVRCAVARKLYLEREEALTQIFKAALIAEEECILTGGDRMAAHGKVKRALLRKLGL